MKKLTKKDWKNIHGIMEFVLDSLDPDMIKDYNSVVRTFNKVEDIQKAAN